MMTTSEAQSPSATLVRGHGGVVDHQRHPPVLDACLAGALGARHHLPIADLAVAHRLHVVRPSPPDVARYSCTACARRLPSWRL